MLNSYLDSLASNHLVKPTTLKFFLLKKDKSVTTVQRTVDQFDHVDIFLDSNHMPTVIHDILTKCKLPIEKELQDLVQMHQRKSGKTPKRRGSIRWSSSVMDFMSDEFSDLNDKDKRPFVLSAWLSENLDHAKERLLNTKPVVKENVDIIERIKAKHRLKGFIGYEDVYTQLTINGALRRLEGLLEQSVVERTALHDKIIKLGNFNGLDHVGRMILDITDVPSTWATVRSNSFILLNYRDLSLWYLILCLRSKYEGPRRQKSGMNNVVLHFVKCC